MMEDVTIDVIIPAYNEQDSIALVLRDIPRPWVRKVIVCNNASKDKTATVAEAHGAIVVHQPQKGYGSACLKGMEYIRQLPLPPDIVVFMDADYSDHPEELPDIVQPIMKDDVDLVIGSRALGNMDH